MLFSTTATTVLTVLSLGTVVSASFHPKMTKQLRRNACTAGNGLSSSGFCVPCAAGTYSIDGTCIPAPTGSYVPASGSSAFVMCPAGTSSGERGMPSCTRCAPSLFSKDGATSCSYCPSGFSTIDRIHCVPCKTGYFSSYGETCEACPKGSVSTVVGSKSCTPCGPNSFSDVIGGMGCLSCPTGLFSAAGSTSSEQCTKGYRILVTSPNTFSKLGYIAKDFGSRFKTYNYDVVGNALIVNLPTSFTAPSVNLVATTSHATGSNLVIALGNSPFSRTFSPSTNGFAWIAGGAQSDHTGYFSSATDYNAYIGSPTTGDGLGESNVWKIGNFDPYNGRYPLTLNFADNVSQSVTNAYIFADASSGSVDNYLGISSSSTETRFTSQKVLLFLEPVV